MHSPNVQHYFVGAQDSCAPCPQHRRILQLFSLLCLVFCLANILTGCQSTPAKRYPLQAEVISVDPPRKLIVVKHGEIPGLMPAMTMSYAVRDEKEIDTLNTGDKITAELVVAENVGHLEKILLVSKASDIPAHAPTTTK